MALLTLAGVGITLAQNAFPDATQQSWLKFDFGSGPAKAPFVLVNPEWTYTDERGFGYEPGAEFIPDAGGISEKSFSFSAKVPEGNYRVPWSWVMPNLPRRPR